MRLVFDPVLNAQLYFRDDDRSSPLVCLIKVNSIVNKRMLASYPLISHYIPMSPTVG